jgi:hypothetical protein
MWEGTELSLPGTGKWTDKDGVPAVLPVFIEQT